MSTNNVNPNASRARGIGGGGGRKANAGGGGGGGGRKGSHSGASVNAGVSGAGKMTADGGEGAEEAESLMDARFVLSLVFLVLLVSNALWRFLRRRPRLWSC